MHLTTPPTTRTLHVHAAMALLQQLVSNHRRMAIYEDPALRAQALAVIPVVELQHRATQGEQVIDQSHATFRDRLLKELLSWFKKDFFSWVNSLACEQCGGETANAGSLAPTAEDKRFGAGRVEAHKCKACNHTTRFPRYNHPGKLLETRRGRCGEWANCFVLCCRAMEFECRYIWDATDHVWAEVYSADLKRWVHCDPCENRWDKPMLYEAGWGKKLSYIFAFSTDEVADVIWKYSVKSTEVMTRRKLCSEAVLAHLIYQLNLQIQGSLPQERRKCLMERSADEIVGLLCRHLPELSEEERMGRQTGSEAWRRARGELGEQPETPADGSNGAVEASANPWMEL
eukprot:m.275330 g.275330  ORF g.275330 m.275330 type:complete len:344 (-) comp19353_c0_seq3:40-1071(-)